MLRALLLGLRVVVVMEGEVVVVGMEEVEEEEAVGVDHLLFLRSSGRSEEDCIL